MDGKDLLRRHFPKVELWKGLALEGVANRDAIPYAEKYGLGEVDGLQSLFRGTLRFVSSCPDHLQRDKLKQADIRGSPGCSNHSGRSDCSVWIR